VCVCVCVCVHAGVLKGELHHDASRGRQCTCHGNVVCVYVCVCHVCVCACVHAVVLEEELHHDASSGRQCTCHGRLKIGHLSW